MLNRRNLIRNSLIISIGSLTAPLEALAASAPAKTAPVESDFLLPTQVVGTIMSNLRPVGIMQADVGIYTKDPRLKASLPLMRPILTANLRAALQEYINRFYTAGQVPDANILAGLMQKAITPQIGASSARILIQAVIAR